MSDVKDLTAIQKRDALLALLGINPHTDIHQTATDADLDIEALLDTHARWILANADRWVRTNVCSPGMVGDALIKNIDQRLDLRRLQMGVTDPEGLDKLLGRLNGQAHDLQEQHGALPDDLLPVTPGAGDDC